MKLKETKLNKLCPNWNFSLENEIYTDCNGIKREESWKKVVGYDGIYEISSIGRLKTHNWRARGKTMIVTPKVTTDGYLAYRLSVKNINKNVTAHRLVATHFIKNNDCTLEVNHKDGIKINNEVTNLEWNTHAENMAHFGKHLYKKGQWGGFNNSNSKLTKEQVISIRNGEHNHLTTAQLSRKLNISWSAIDRVRKGITFSEVPLKKTIHT